jgi:hypothetical protein
MNRKNELMSGWHQLKVPAICERMIGFSVPCEGEVLVLSYQGVHLLRLGSEITVQTDEEVAEYDIYDPSSGIARYRDRDFQIIGLHGGNPILQSLTGESLVLDGKSETLPFGETMRRSSQ